MVEFRMFRLLIYDLDGTLIDSRQDIVDSINWTLQELGLPSLPVEQVSEFVGSGVKNLMQLSLQAAGSKTSSFAAALQSRRRLVKRRSAAGSSGTVRSARRTGAGAAERAPSSGLPPLERSIKLFRGRYGRHLLDQTRLYPSVPPVLEFYKDRKQAVLTNKSQDFSKTLLQGLGVESYFFRLIGGDEGFPRKPAPEAVHELMRQAGAGAGESVFIGDSSIDIQTARNAGIRTVAVTYGFGRRAELEAAKPDWIVDDLKELMNLGNHRDR